MLVVLSLFGLARTGHAQSFIAITNPILDGCGDTSFNLTIDVEWSKEPEELILYSSLLPDGTFRDDESSLNDQTSPQLGWGVGYSFLASSPFPYSATVTYRIENAGVGVAAAYVRVTCTGPDTGTVEVLPSPLLLTKTAAPLVYARPGDTITYTYEVSSLDNDTISNLKVTDDKIADPPGVSCAVTALAPGESTTCTAQHTVTEAEAAGGRITNTAIATGSSTSGLPVESEEATATVTSPAAIPVLDTAGMALLVAALMAMGAVAARRSPPHRG